MAIQKRKLRTQAELRLEKALLEIEFMAGTISFLTEDNAILAREAIKLSKELREKCGPPEEE